MELFSTLDAKSAQHKKLLTVGAYCVCFCHIIYVRYVLL